MSVSISGTSRPDSLRPETEMKVSGDYEGEGDASFLESIEVPVRVRERPQASHVIGRVSTQHGGGRHPVPIVLINNTKLRDSALSESFVEEKEVQVRERPTSSSSRHRKSPLKPGDETRGSLTLHRPSSSRTTRTDDCVTGASDDAGATPISKPRLIDACNEAQPLDFQSNGNGRWCTSDDDTRILRDIREATYQQNIVGLISRQRPGVRGYLDKVTSLLTGKQESLTDADFGYRIHFGDLQRIHIQYLHSKVVNLAVSSHFDDSEWKSGGKAEQMGQVLKEYSKSSPIQERGVTEAFHLKAAAYLWIPRCTVKAVKNHEYMAKYAKATDDPFIATSQWLYDKKFLESAMTAAGDKMPEDFLPQPLHHRSRRELVELLKQQASPTGPWERDNTHKPARALITTRTKAWKRAYWTRIGAALIGGAFLIAPMWILALQRNLFVHLSVATGCVTAFGVSVSLYLETVDGVFAATLAYAAVIMVFVGIVIEETGGKGV